MRISTTVLTHNLRPLNGGVRLIVRTAGFGLYLRETYGQPVRRAVLRRGPEQRTWTVAPAGTALTLSEITIEKRRAYPHLFAIAGSSLTTASTLSQFSSIPLPGMSGAPG